MGLSAPFVVHGDVCLSVWCQIQNRTAYVKTFLSDLRTVDFYHFYHAKVFRWGQVDHCPLNPFCTECVVRSDVYGDVLMSTKRIVFVVKYVCGSVIYGDVQGCGG